MIIISSKGHDKIEGKGERDRQKERERERVDRKIPKRAATYIKWEIQIRKTNRVET